MSENAGTTNEKIIYYNGEFIKVSKELYYAYYRPIWRQIKRMQNLQKCNCPKKMIYKCPQECFRCKYHKGANVSFDEMLETRGDLPDEKSMDFIENDLLEELIGELSRIDEHTRVIVQMKLEGYLDKEIAEELNLSTSTFSYRKKRLYKKAKIFFEKI
ncbi:MAG: hypothetical protein ACI4I9_08210 [Porcipelethomonas sp.]